jgi:hypothetical protein
LVTDLVGRRSSRCLRGWLLLSVRELPVPDRMSHFIRVKVGQQVVDDRIRPLRGSSSEASLAPSTTPNRDSSSIRSMLQKQARASRLGGKVSPFFWQPISRAEPQHHETNAIPKRHLRVPLSSGRISRSGAQYVVVFESLFVVQRSSRFASFVQLLRLAVE